VTRRHWNTLDEERRMTDRLACANPACSRTILPATAAATGGLCGPCRRAQATAADAAFLQANRRTIDPYAGITDPVTLILRIMEPRPVDPLIVILPPPASLEDLYASLTPTEAARLVDAGVQAFAEGKYDLAEAIARCVVCLTAHPITALLDAFVTQQHYHPSIAFARAGPTIRDLLLQHIQAPDAPYNALLLALAWIGDAQVVQQFAAWRAQPPSWAATLNVPPEDYALEAGWELLPGARRHDLVATVAYALVPRSVPAPSPVTVVQETPETCGWCGTPMTALFTLDGTAPALTWLAVNAVMVIRTCVSCACYGVIYTSADPTQPVWHPANQHPPFLPDDSGPPLPADQLVLAAQSRLPWYAADWFLPIRFSQVGGHPTWIDDASYPRCPDCTRRMPVVAQLSVADIEPGEGIYYAFLCSPCRIAATSYQQS
jgi:hypothetical protein